jgi:hypothetical protein
MKFGDAIEAMREGKKVRRSGWNGKGMSLEAVMPPPPDSPITEPYVMIHNTKGRTNAWNASQQDLFANDWEVAE